MSIKSINSTPLNLVFYSFRAWMKYRQLFLPEWNMNDLKFNSQWSLFHNKSYVNWFQVSANTYFYLNSDLISSPQVTHHFYLKNSIDSLDRISKFFPINKISQQNNKKFKGFVLQFIHNNSPISVVFIFNNYFGVIDQVIENNNLEGKTKIRSPVREDSDKHGGKSWVEEREQQQKFQKVNKIKHSNSKLTFSFSFLPCLPSTG